MITPAPTIAPEAQPVDVIVEFIAREDSVAIELWKYCVGEWGIQYYAFDPENYFREPESDVEEVVPGDGDDGSAGDDDLEDESVVPDLEEPAVAAELTPEAREQLILYAPMISALKDYWTSLIIFTEDNPTAPQWSQMCDAMQRYIAFQPEDRDRLIRHVRRIHQARLEAEALMPKAATIQQNTVLFDILNGKN